MLVLPPWCPHIDRIHILSTCSLSENFPKSITGGTDESAESTHVQNLARSIIAHTGSIRQDIHVRIIRAILGLFFARLSNMQ